MVQRGRGGHTLAHREHPPPCSPNSAISPPRTQSLNQIAFACGKVGLPVFERFADPTLRIPLKDMVGVFPPRTDIVDSVWRTKSRLVVPRGTWPFSVCDSLSSGALGDMGHLGHLTCRAHKLAKLEPAWQVARYGFHHSHSWSEDCYVFSDRLSPFGLWYIMIGLASCVRSSHTREYALVRRHMVLFLEEETNKVFR